MAKMTAAEWIRTITPLIVIAAAVLVSHTRLDGKVESLEKRLEAECSRSQTIDSAQDSAQRQAQLSVVEMKTDIRYIKESVAHNADTQQEILTELRK